MIIAAKRHKGRKDNGLGWDIMTDRYRFKRNQYKAKIGGMMKDYVFTLADAIRETSFAIHRYHRHGHLEKVYENA